MNLPLESWLPRVWLIDALSSLDKAIEGLAPSDQMHYFEIVLSSLRLGVALRTDKDERRNWGVDML